MINKNKKNIFTFLAVLLLVGTSLIAQDSPILDAERQRFQAQVEQDAAALELLLHDDLRYLHSNGLIESKAVFIASATSGKITYQEMTPVENQLRRFGKTAVITGLVQVRGLYQGRSFDIDLYYTSVYRKERGRWQLLNWQSTQKPDE